MEQYVSAIVSLLLVVFMGILMGAAQHGKPTVEPGTGFLGFRHHLLLRSFSLLMAFGIPIGITILVFIKPPTNQRDYIAIFGLYALFAVLTVPLLWESMRFSLVVGPEGLDCRSPWRARQFYRWEEVEKLSYNFLLGLFVIHAVGGRKFRVLVLVPGLNAFLEACERRLSPDKLKRAKAGYDQLGRAFPGEESGKG